MAASQINNDNASFTKPRSRLTSIDNATMPTITQSTTFTEASPTRLLYQAPMLANRLAGRIGYYWPERPSGNKLADFWFELELVPDFPGSLHGGRLINQRADVDTGKACRIRRGWLAEYLIARLP